ncbi:MAG: NCS2 family permease [Verrucomicrobiota bacterium]
MKLFVKGDIDGLFALGLDNLLMLILMTSLCLGFPLFLPPDIYFQKILPATALGVIFGNLIYARMALKLAEKEGRSDVCAVPYGINLITIIVFVFLVMFPAKLIALANGASELEAANIAWRAGLIACVASGVIEAGCAFFAGWVQRVTPRAALLSALASIGLFFIAGDFFFRAYAVPMIGMTTLAITLLIYFGRVEFKGGVPGGVVILLVGTVMAWGLHLLGFESVVPVGSLNFDFVGLNLPWPVVGEIWAGLPQLMPYLPVIIPMGFISGVVSMQNLESAKAAGDDYPVKPALLTNGFGSLLAGCCGSPFPTTIYIGHPGWKAIGSRAGYSILTAIAMGLLCVSGLLSLVVYLIPVEAGMAILIWIGLMMCAQAFDVVPKRHYPAVAIGLLPGLAAFTALVSKQALRATGFGGPDNPFPSTLVADFVERTNFFADGMYALEAGYVYSSIVLAASTVCIIERKLKLAAIWYLVGAALSACGMMHAYVVTPADVISEIRPALKWVLGYSAMALIVYLIPFVSKKTEEVN